MSQVFQQQDPHHKSAEDFVDSQEEDAPKQKLPKPVELKIDPNRPRYGRMKIMFERPFLFSVGPDYPCFIGGFLFFVLLAYLLCYTVGSVFQNGKIIMAAYILSILQCGSYLVVAVSNPSISLREQNPIKQITTENQHRVCPKCGAQQRRRTYHCRQCDVCVHGYDHHCPWTSKCIGQGNLYQFYLFVTITPVYILAFIGLMMGCLLVTAQTANHNIRRPG